MRMKHLCAVPMLLLVGCAQDVGPIGTPDFEQFLRSSVDLGEEPVRLYARAEWYPGADAWTFSGPSRFEQGVVVLQESRLLFLEWEPREGSFDVALEIPYSIARDVRRRVWMGSHVMVVETEDGSTEAFSLLSNNGIGISVPRTNRALAILRETIPSSDAPPGPDPLKPPRARAGSE